MTKILIGLGIVAVLIVGGVVIADVIDKKVEESKVPYVNITDVRHSSDNIYDVKFDYYNIRVNDIIVFYISGEEVYRVTHIWQTGQESCSGHRNFTLTNPHPIPTLANLSYTIIR